VKPLISCNLDYASVDTEGGHIEHHLLPKPTNFSREFNIGISMHLWRQYQVKSAVFFDSVW